MEATKFNVNFPSISSLNNTSFCRPNLHFVHNYHNIAQLLQLKSKIDGYRNFPASSSFSIRCSKNRVDESQSLSLESIRHSLILQEDCIIHSLLLRAQYSCNADMYNRDALSMDGFNGSLVEFIVRETEKLHAWVGRYESLDEHAFFPEHLPEPIWTNGNLISKSDGTTVVKSVLHLYAGSINMNKKVWDSYFRYLLLRLVKDGNDGNCGSSAVCDTMCLQALSRRIHFGKFVAEAKFQESPADYEAAIGLQDREKLMELLTCETVETAVKKRVEKKAKTFCIDVTMKPPEDKSEPIYIVEPSLVVDLYDNLIMPLTKEVQVEYLLRRLD